MKSSIATQHRPLALLTATLLALALGASGCGSSGQSKSATAGDSAKRGFTSAEGAQRAGGSQSDAKGSEDASARKSPKLVTSHVIRTAKLTVRVKDVNAALSDARTTAESAGGYIGDETTNRDPGGHERSHVVLRVPQEAYDRVLGDLAGAGKLVERKVDEKDVSDQVVDVKSRITSQQASVVRVRKLMDQATQLSDVVLLEGELSTRQAELEALKAQQDSLEDRTSMATISLILSETAAKPKEDDETSFADALAGGWDAFVTTARWVAVAVGTVLPFAAALALVLLVWRAAHGRLPARAARKTDARGTTPPPVTVPAPLTPPGERAAESDTADKRD